MADEKESYLKGLAAEILANVTADTGNKRRHSAETALNLAFLSGNQWTMGDRLEGLTEIEQLDEVERVTDNRMIKHYRWWYSKLFNSDPQIQLYAGGDEIIDDRRSMVTQRIVEYVREQCGWKEAEQEAARWVYNGGKAFLAPVWRKNFMKPERRDLYKPLAEPVDNGEGVLTYLEKVGETVHFQRDITVDAYTPLQVVCCPVGVKVWKKVECVITLDILTKEAVQRRYGIDPDTAAIKSLSDRELNFNALRNVDRFTSDEFSFGSEIEAKQGQGLYLEAIARYKPDAEHPDGRYVVVVGERVIEHYNHLPYIEEAREADPQDKYNISFGLVPWFAMPWHTMDPPCPAGTQRPYQVRLNDILTDEAENRKTLGRNYLLVDEDKFKNPDQWTDEDGLKLEVESNALTAGGGLPAQILRGGPMIGLETEKAGLIESMNEAGGRTRAMMGENTANVRSAWHFGMINEEAGTDIGIDIGERERCHQIMGRFIIAMARRRYTTQHIVSIFGAERAGLALEWKNMNIQTDLRVKPGSGMPRNKAAIQAMAVELWRYQAFIREDGTPDIDAFWNMIELGTLNRSVSDRMKHIKRAESIFNRMLYTTEFIPPEEHEDHNTYIRVFRGRMAEPEFEAASADRQNRIIVHLRARTEMLIKQMMPGAGQPGPDSVAQKPGLDKPAQLPPAGRGAGQQPATAGLPGVM